MAEHHSGTVPMRAIFLATAVVQLILVGCVVHETHGDPAVPESERTEVVGYWHYRVLYDEELHIVSVDGEHGDWPQAYSVSLPSGKHWLQLAVLRNSNEIARCAFEWTFEAGRQYKLKELAHDQFLLAHPESALFEAIVSIDVSEPAKPTQHVQVSAVCGKDAMCRQDSDCAAPLSCRTGEGFPFGGCRAR